MAVRLQPELQVQLVHWVLKVLKVVLVLSPVDFSPQVV
jgi:hypothetical protein